MAKNNDVGLFQLPNGNWGFRVYVNGKDTTYRRDKDGNPFKTKNSAKTAREEKIVELRKSKTSEETIKDVTIKDLWEYYLEHDAKDKEVSTVTKYKSLWKNHVKKKFATKKVSEVTVGMVNDFLRDLYDTGLSFSYVESFLKMFHLLFGIAYRNENISTARYTRMFLDKGTKIKMPPKREEEDEEDVQAYTMHEIKQMHDIFEGGNLYTAFLIGYFLGVRISECFALTWDDINWSKKTIMIDKQMNFEEGCICLGKVKTLAAKREIDIPDILHQHLLEKCRKYYKIKDKDGYRNTEIVYDKRNKHNIKRIQGGDFINRKLNGELLTINSMKYYAKEIKKKTGIEFKYHALRKTHITQLVAMNTPAVEVMHRVGHKKFDTTLSYYVNSEQLTKDILKTNINIIQLEEREIEITTIDGEKKILKEHEYEALQKFMAQYPH